MPLFNPVNFSALPNNIIPDGNATRTLGSASFDWSSLRVRTILSSVADGASAVGVILDTGAAFANAGSKLVSFRNNGTEKIFVDKDGRIQSATGVTVALVSPNGSGVLQSNDSTGTVVGYGTNQIIVDGTRTRQTAARFQTAKGANVTAANDTTLGSDGNYFVITGTTTINGIASASWQSGSRIILQLPASLTVKHNTAAGAGFASLSLNGNVDLVTTVQTMLPLVYDGTLWQQESAVSVRA